MIPFFRKIRYGFAMNNQPASRTGRFLKYSRYAIGEIVLVVIGILIALQINEWNDNRLKRNLEVEFLREINDNLLKDTAKINEVLEFNKTKMVAIKSMMIRFEEAKSGDFDLQAFSQQMNILGTYDKFLPNRTAFDNLLDTETIGLISNRDLRTLISKYYKFDFVDGTQKTVQDRTRAFTETASTHLTTKENMYGMFGVNLDLKSSQDTQIFRDEEVITAMVYMSITLSYQNQLMETTLNDVNKILDLIEEETKGKY